MARNSSVPFLGNLIRQATTQVTGENVGGIKSIHGTSSSLPRIGASMCGAFSNGLRMSQMSNGGGATNYTAPGFYTPFTQPSAFQIPNNRKEVYLWAQWWFDNEPKVAAGIEFYTDFPLSGFKLECPNAVVKNWYEKIVKVLNFPKWLPLLSQEYHLRGDVFPMTALNCSKCQGLGVVHGRRCEHEGATWKSITILNPDMVEVTPAFLGQEPFYMLRPDEAMIKVVQEQKPKQIFDSIHPTIRKKIQQKEPLEIMQECIYHLKRGSAPWAPFGQSMLRRLFQTLAYKDKLRQAQWLVAERHILPIKIVKLGDKDRPASPEDLQNAQDELTAVAQDPNLTLVTHHAFDFDYVGACYSDETEVLTQSGFKLFKEVADSEEVACYDPDTEQMQWHVPTHRHEHDYNSSLYGPLINFTSKHYDSVVTPNHEMWAKKRKWNLKTNRYEHPKWEKIRAENITDHDRFLSTLTWNGTTPDILPYTKECALLADVELDDFLAFAGYYLSEGSLKNQPNCIGGHSSTVIYQKAKTESNHRIENVMKKCFGDKTCMTDVTAGAWEPVTHFIVHNVGLSQYMQKEFGHGSDKKSLPRWILDLPNDKLNILLDALVDGDGDITTSGLDYTKTRYSTTSKLLADSVQEIVLKLGYNPKISFVEKRSKSHHLPIYRVYWAREAEERVVRSRNIKHIDYNGKVYCFTVPTGILITRLNGKIGIHGNSGKVLQLTQEYELIDNEITAGLMLNNAIFTGEGPTLANATVGLITMAKRLERFRQEVAYWIEEKVFRPLAIWNGFVNKNEQGEEEYVVPTIKWDDLQLRDESNKLQVMMQARQNGDISAETIMDALGVNYDQEVERLRMEQMANMVNSPTLLGGQDQMGGGFGGAGLGMGGGGGMDMGMPPMPPMGGAGGAPGGEAAPGGAPGGPGGTPAMPDMGGPGPMAYIDKHEHMYRVASTTMKELYQDRVGEYWLDTQKKYSKKGYKSDIHRRFVMSMMPVSGRGNLGLLPERMDDICPIADFVYPKDGGILVTPMNRLAYKEYLNLVQADEHAEPLTRSREVFAGLLPGVGKKKGKNDDNYGGNKQFFSRIEQKLYSIILEAGIPLPFYAQYQAGPDMRYQLDGAFPTIQLAVEADSETFHNTPDKIAKDRWRDMQLMSQGWHVLRFTEKELEERPEQVMAVVYQAVRKLMGSQNQIRT